MRDPQDSTQLGLPCIFSTEGSSLWLAHPLRAPRGTPTRSGLAENPSHSRRPADSHPLWRRLGRSLGSPRPSLPAGGAARPRPPSCSSSGSNRSGGGRMAGGLSAPQARRGSGRAPAQARGPRSRSRCRRGGHGLRRARLFPSGGGSAAGAGSPAPPRRPAPPAPAPRPAAPCPPPGTFPGASSHLPWRRSWEPRPELPRSAAPSAAQAGPHGGRAGPHGGGPGPGPGTEQGRRWKRPPDAALRERPRNTQGPAWASRPAWSPQPHALLSRCSLIPGVAQFEDPSLQFKLLLS